MPADWKGKKVGVWDFGNDYEVIAAARKNSLEANTDYQRVIQPFDMSLLLNRQIDTAEAMIYNEYAQVLEANNPATGQLYQPTDINVINFNDVGTAMLQDAIWARSAWLSQAGNSDVAVKFLRASFQGWMFCRDNPAKCVQYVTQAGSILGAGHQAWMMNEINPLIWPQPMASGTCPRRRGTRRPDRDRREAHDQGRRCHAFRTDLAQQARTGITGDVNGASFQKGTVQVTAGGK